MRKTMHILWLMCVLCAACTSGDGGTASPRPDAWPRLYIYPTTYVGVEGAPLYTRVNSNAAVSSTDGPDGAYWVNVEYPRYNATIYLTYTPVSDAASRREVLSNRHERIGLNIGGAPTTVVEGVSASGGATYLYVSPSALTTPYQFVVDDARYVVSGSVYFAPGARRSGTTDSIAPVLEALRADVDTLLRSIR